MKGRVQLFSAILMLLLMSPLGVGIGFGQKRGPSIWLIEIPDISVKFCPNLLGPLPDPKKSYSLEISTQMLFSAAAFMIENPQKAKDQQAIYSAGVEGALKVYQAIMKKDPSAKMAYLDTLVEKRDQSKLEEHVRQAMKKCK